jgi:hypothetical protein
MIAELARKIPLDAGGRSWAQVLLQGPDAVERADHRDCPAEEAHTARKKWRFAAYRLHPIVGRIYTCLVSRAAFMRVAERAVSDDCGGRGEDLPLGLTHHLAQ